MSEAQRAALERAQAARRAQLAARKNGDGLVRTTATEIRELQELPAVPDDDDQIEEPDPEPEPEPPRAVPAAARPNGRPKSLDDVVAKHQQTAPPIPTMADVAAQTRIYALGSDPIPPPELNPMLQDGMSSDTELPPEDMVGTQPPKSIEDLMSLCPMIGNGQYYVRVERKGPPHYGGLVCKGLQRSIQRYMTARDFVREYGGGDYALILYGPPKRGAAIDPRSGTPRVKALTPAVNVSISTSVYPPNLQAAVLDDDGMPAIDPDDEEAMRFAPPFHTNTGTGAFARPSTTADAKMFEASLNHEERLRDREDRERKEAREREERAQQAMSPTLEFIARGNQQVIETLERQSAERDRMQREQLERERRERERAERRAEEERNKPTDVVQMITALGPVLKPQPQDEKAIEHMRAEMARMSEKHAGEMTRLLDKHSADLTRLSDGHKTEMGRQADANRTEMDRVLRGHADDLKRAEERMREQVDRAEKRAEEAERKAEARIRDTEERAERRLAELREEMRRQADERDRVHQTRLEDERRQHDRDSKSQATMFETRIAGQKDMYENRLSTVAQEIVRLNAEVDRYRKEAEDNKDIGKHIERVQSAAEVLGWGPADKNEPDAPKDWKEMMGRIGMDLVQKLPEIVQSAGETVQRLRTPGATPEQVQAAQYHQMMTGAAQSVPRGMVQPPPPMTSGPMRFASEGGIPFNDRNAPTTHSAFDLSVPPPMPGMGMMPPPIMPPPPPIPPMAMQPATASQPAAVQPPMQPAPSVQPTPSAVPSAALAPAGAPMVIPPELVHQFAPALEQAFTSGEPPANVARELLKMLPREQFTAITRGLTPQQLVVELQRSGHRSSPLVRRAGQQFLRDLWAEAEKLLGS